MIWLGDDMGAQETLLLSPDMWRKYFKPRMAEIISTAKSVKPDIMIAYHTDGYNIPIIPELIEIGLDVLNPIQAESMNPEELKREFGDRLSFFGAMDVQSTLPLGSPEEVKAEFSDRFNTIGRNGGWLCAPTHHIQLDTPMQNLQALVEVVQKTYY
jgi:uroporphyrinogen decarboxylase